MTITRIRTVALAGVAAAILATGGVVAVSAGGGKSDLAKVKAATTHFHSTEAAQAAGYDLRDGLDHCFQEPGVGAMGYHYINTDKLADLILEANAPEAMVYAPGPNGKLQLAAVEWIVDKPGWDAENTDAQGNITHPEVLGEHLHPALNDAVYVLHAWIFKNNPEGMFEDWNPKVTCPAD